MGCVDMGRPSCRAFSTAYAARTGKSPVAEPGLSPGDPGEAGLGSRFGALLVKPLAEPAGAWYNGINLAR